MTPPSHCPTPSPRPGWSDRLRSDPGRALVELVGGLLAGVLAYVALVVATLSWCIPDSCERSLAGIVAGTMLFGALLVVALRWLSLRRVTWQHAAIAGTVAAAALVVYEMVDHLL